MQEINTALSRLSETKELMVFSEFSKYANAIRRSAFSQHLMEPVNSKGLLVRVSIKETEIINSVFPDYGWRNYFKGGLKIIETEGDHISMLRSPNHHVLAKQLNEELSIF